MTVLALDTSVAIPLLVRSHRAHDDVVRWWGRRPVVLSGHALVETYSVLARRPADLRLAAADAAQLLESRFGAPLTLQPSTAEVLPRMLAGLGISGGAVDDALVAVAATEDDADLATRDARARETYARIGVRVVDAG